MKKGTSLAVKILIPVICILILVLSPDIVKARADSGETVRVTTSAQLKAAIKRADVGTIILRTQKNFKITIKASKAAKNKELIVDAPGAEITNKAVFSRINIVSAASFVEKVSGNEILLSGDVKKGLTVSAKKKVKKLTVYTPEGFYLRSYTLRKGAGVKSLEIAYAGGIAPVWSKWDPGKRKLSLTFTNPYDCKCSHTVTLDKSGRMTRIVSKSDSAEFSYDYSFAYDANGNIIKMSGNDNEDGDFTDTYEYSADNRVLKAEFEGYSAGEDVFTYDKKGRLVTETYTSRDSIDGIAFTNTYVTSYSYDKKGRIISEKETHTTVYDNAEYPEGVFTMEKKYTYDNKGFLIREEHENKNGNEEYRQTTSYEYDKDDNLVKTVVSSDGSMDEISEYKYDEFGELIDYAG